MQSWQPGCSWRRPSPARLRVFKVPDAGVQIVDHQAGQLAVYLTNLSSTPAGMVGWRGMFCGFGFLGCSTKQYNWQRRAEG